MLAVLRAPRSYTREDTVEVYCHGGALVLHRILDLFLREGACLAEPGEFTKRAFLNGRIDLTQAEAVMDLIQAKTEAGHRAAMAQLGGVLHRRILDLRIDAIRLLAEIEAGIDFTEEGIEFIAMDQIRGILDGLIHRIEALLETAASGKALREGIATAIVGRPNVGKSSLLNALLMQNRAIVTPFPGTTRDTVEEYLNIDGIPFRIMDTAGLREPEDEVERQGVMRSHQAIEQADLVLLVVDATRPLGADEEQMIRRLEQKPHLLILNKMDQLRSQPGLPSGSPPGREGAIYTSALTGEGLESLRKAVAEMIRGGVVTCGEREAMVNSRQKALLLQAKQSVLQAMKSSEAGTPAELIAIDLRRGIDQLGEMTGETTTEDLLDRIFSEFCIGK